MVKKSHIYIEGADSKEDQARCREAFRKLLEKANLSGRLPRLSACGGRERAFDDFKTAQAGAKSGDFIGLLVDSEEPVSNTEKPWEHLKNRDHWNQPAGTTDEQVFLMTTCMESWIAADRKTLKGHYGHKLQESALPELHNPEDRHRRDVQNKLERATRDCSNAYRKGRRSFEILGKLNATLLEKILPSFARMVRILRKRL